MMSATSKVEIRTVSPRWWRIGRWSQVPQLVPRSAPLTVVVAQMKKSRSMLSVTLTAAAIADATAPTGTAAMRTALAR